MVNVALVSGVEMVFGNRAIEHLPTYPFANTCQGKFAAKSTYF